VKREHVLLALLAVVLLGAAALGYRLLRSEEDQVRKVIHGAAASAVARDAAGVVGRLDESFVGPQDVKLPLATEYLRYALGTLYRKVEVTVTPEEFPVALSQEDTRATVNFTLVARGQAPDGRWVDLVHHWKTGPQWSVDLVQRDGTWRILAIHAPPR
jgi:hypothetical protein